MELENTIRNFVLEFFETNKFEISCENKIYFVDVPEKNQNFFEKSRIVFTFDQITANENNCELIIPGSKTLFKIITLCNKKGPVIKKEYPNTKGYCIIRYHFFVSFSGTTSESQLFVIDIDLEKLQIMDVNKTLESRKNQFNFEMFSKNITKSYLLSLEELKQQSTSLKDSFLNSSDERFQLDYNLFVKRYDDEISEQDKSINEKEEIFGNSDKMKKYRFDTLDKINNLEKIKNEMIVNLQNKHKISLDYNLIAAEILLF